MNELIPEKIENWSDKTIEKLIELEYDEDQHVEYKERLEVKGDNKRSYRQKIEDLMCSFANAKGGFIIFGLTDRREVVGVSIGEQEEANLKVNQIISNSIPKIIFQSKIVTMDKNKVLIIKVEESSDKPIQCSNGSFQIRMSGETISISRDYLRDSFISKEVKKQKLNKLLFEINSFKEISKEEEKLDSSIAYPIFYKLNIYDLELAVSEYSGYLKDGCDFHMNEIRKVFGKFKKWKSFFDLEMKIELKRSWGKRWTGLSGFLDSMKNSFFETNKEINSVIISLNHSLDHLKPFF